MPLFLILLFTSVLSLSCAGQSKDILPPSYLSMNTRLDRRDTVNSAIKITGTDLSEAGFHLEIKNRWSALVFQSDSLTHMMKTGWDGRKDDVLLGNGFYLYEVSYQDNKGNTFEKKGYITIE